MTTPPPADDLLQQLSAGEMAAAETLFQLYTPYLRAVVRRQISERLRVDCDSRDIVQSVWVRVVRQLGRDGWQLRGEDHLRALLATMARRRVIDRYRRLGPIHSNATLEIALEAGGDSPSAMVQADDLWAKMLRLCPPEHRAVLTLRREGLLLREIAVRTGLHEGSVRRILRKLARDLALAEKPLDPEDRL